MDAEPAGNSCEFLVTYFACAELEAVRRQVAGFEAPKAVIVVDELAKASTGNI